jgi:general secretion pathway protein I
MRKTSQAGFTLLEMLVATTIMGVAVVGLLSSLSTSMRNSTHITEADKVSQIAHNKMEELLSDKSLPYQGTLEGNFDSASGWTAQLAPFEVPPKFQPGMAVLQRISLVVWWKDGDNQRQYPVEAYRIVDSPVPQQ